MEEQYECGICYKNLSVEEIATHSCLFNNKEDTDENIFAQHSESEKDDLQDDTIKLQDEDLRKNEDNVNTQDSLLTDGGGNNEKCKIWTRSEVLILLSVYKQYKDDLNHPVKRRVAWKKILDSIKVMDVRCTIVQAQNKIKILLRTYKKIKDNKNKTGRGYMKFEFFEEMDDIFGKSKAINPVHVVSSICKASLLTTECNTSPSTPSNNVQLPSAGSTTTSSTSTTKKKRKLEKENDLNKYLKYKETLETEKKKLKQDYFEEWKKSEEMKAKERAKRHEEKMKIEKKKIDLLEKLLLSKVINS